jgi:hypothetical protein
MRAVRSFFIFTDRHTVNEQRIKIPRLNRFIPQFAGLSLLLAALSSDLALAREPTMVLDPSLTQDEVATWLGYLGARAAYREKHKLPSPQSGEIVPTFNEEVEARGVAVAFYAVMNSRKDNYWDTVAKVQSAGFLKEYVWTYLHRPTWGATQPPKNLQAFSNWRRVNLKDHKAETRGKLMAK